MTSNKDRDLCIHRQTDTLPVNTQADGHTWKVRGRRLGGPQAHGGTRDKDRVTKRQAQTQTQRQKGKQQGHRYVLQVEEGKQKKGLLGMKLRY